MKWSIFTQPKADLPPEKTWDRDGFCGRRSRFGESELDSRLRLPGSEVRCWQESVRPGLVFIRVNIMMYVAFSTWSYCCNLCDTLILRLWRKLCRPGSSLKRVESLLRQVSGISRQFFDEIFLQQGISRLEAIITL